MEFLSYTIYIQSVVHLYKNQYVIFDDDLSKLLNINVSKLIKKYHLKNVFCIKLRNNYLITQDGILFLSIILNSYKYDRIIISILDSIKLLEKINDIYYLNRIKLY